MLHFTKMQACGNDFVIVDDRAGKLAGLESPLAALLCRRHFGIGADGMLVLRAASRAAPDGVPAFGMVYVNADGLVGEMCGNGARCLAAFIRRAGLAREHLVLDTAAGAVEVRFQDGEIVLDLPPPGAPRDDIAVHWRGRDWLFDAIDIGVPHAVSFVDSRAALAAAPVAELGRHARHHAAFMPRGANINFVALDQGRLYLRTYERGVEEETLGCGTGATAAALLAHRRFGLPSPLTVVTSSGEALRIRFDGIAGKLLQLCGGAHFVAEGETCPGFADHLLRSPAEATA
ncbi:diaminopimelate epimerase [Herbaspirillum robiniae]|nr:diaminopimelate epimerase [Herbaspirillum robiniae]